MGSLRSDETGPPSWAWGLRARTLGPDGRACRLWSSREGNAGKLHTQTGPQFSHLQNEDNDTWVSYLRLTQRRPWIGDFRTDICCHMLEARSPRSGCGQAGPSALLPRVQAATRPCLSTPSPLFAHLCSKFPLFMRTAVIVGYSHPNDLASTWSPL